MTEREAIVGITGMLVLLSGFVLGLLVGIWLNRSGAELLRVHHDVSGPPHVKPEWISNSQPQPGTAGYTIVSAVNGRGSLGRSRYDEPVFVLCARDAVASEVVRYWATLAEYRGVQKLEIESAIQVAADMDLWLVARQASAKVAH